MDVKESVRKDALQKIRDHISDASICMITNNILEWSLQPEPLKNQWLDEQGNIWFLCFQPRNESAVLVDGRMEIFYSNRLKSKFLSLVGEITWATFSDVRDVKGFPFAIASTLGSNTPMRLAKFSPDEAFYWDDITKDMVALPLFESAGSKKRMVA
jgi:hypothetical protein